MTIIRQDGEEWIETHRITIPNTGASIGLKTTSFGPNQGGRLMSMQTTIQFVTGNAINQYSPVLESNFGIGAEFNDDATGIFLSIFQLDAIDRSLTFMVTLHMRK